MAAILKTKKSKQKIHFTQTSQSALPIVSPMGKGTFSNLVPRAILKKKISPLFRLPLIAKRCAGTRLGIFFKNKKIGSSDIE